MASVSLATPQPIERLALRLVGWLIPLIAFWWLVAPLYSDAVFAVSDAALGLDPALNVALAKNGAGVPTVYQITQGTEQPAFRFDRVGLFYNTVVLLALMLAVPGWRWRTRLTRLSAALGLLALAHVGFVVVQTKAQFINLGLMQTSEFLAYLTNWLAVLVGPVGEALFPLAIALGLGWSAWAEAFDLRPGGHRETSTAVGRNDPCPCGSGHKFKHCCGST